MQERKAKTTSGVVIKNRGRKSLTVAVDYKVRHPKYGKYLRRRTRLAVHDEHSSARIGDIVEVAECRPCSKTKSWRLVKIIRGTEQL